MTNLADTHPKSDRYEGLSTCMILGFYPHGKRLQLAKAMVTAGLKWAPETWPTEQIITITVKPQVMAMPGSITTPSIVWFTTTTAQPANMRK
jgi:hypothetical protein